ncbi:transcriptional Coactivator p15-domain-containing protein [Phlyctochytrium arcticum]|nr:transcriptional Coactivator p15-domain-containing protein [Phlyctochytrium arcticum]
MPPKGSKRAVDSEQEDEFELSDGASESGAVDKVAPSPKKAKTTANPEKEALSKLKDGKYELLLDGKKRLSISKFKNLTLVDIREYYKDKTSGTEKPGKKGISISVSAWKTIKEHFEEIDSAITQIESSN